MEHVTIDCDGCRAEGWVNVGGVAFVRCFKCWGVGALRWNGKKYERMVADSRWLKNVKERGDVH